MKQNRLGFTLIEMMLVVIIIGILAAMVAPRLTGRAEEARIQSAQADIHSNITMALDLYEFDVGYFPAILNELWEKPAQSPAGYKGPYLKRAIGADPWATPYAYTPLGGGKGYRLSSAGPDRQQGTEDDITAESLP
jgi:general secretion pathway protein G